MTFTRLNQLENKLAKTNSLESLAGLTLHLISHNHWDREWIFTARYTNRGLVPFFDNLFKMLAAQPDYRFVLDGQTRLIEDYLSQLPEEEAVEQEKLLRQYAQAGRLMVAPAYLQLDWSLVSGEALVRNLIIGGRMAAQFGSVMKVGCGLVENQKTGRGISGALLRELAETTARNETERLRNCPRITF